MPQSSDDSDGRGPSDYSADELAWATLHDEIDYACPGFDVRRDLVYLVARECTPTAEQRLDPNESIRVETTTFEQLLAVTLAGQRRDGRTALGVLHYALTHPRGEDHIE